MSALRQLIARALYPYGATRRVLRGPLRGTRFKVCKGMGVTFALGHRAYGAERWRSRIRPGMSVYDIGANVGQSALVLAKLVGPTGRVHSFEPWPEMYEALVRNIALNGLQERVHAMQAAVAASAGSAEFRLDPARPTMGKLATVEAIYQIPGDTSITVPTVSIDDLIAGGLAPPDALKIDVEGAAEDVLRGAQRTIREHRPLVYVELHTGTEKYAVCEHLKAVGYRLLREDGSEVLNLGTPTGWASPLWCLPAE